MGRAANAEAIDSKDMSKNLIVTNLLTPEVAAHFSRPVLDAIMGLVSGPKLGESLDLSAADSSGNFKMSGGEVVKSAVYGHCSEAEATAELNRRIDEAASEVAIAKLTANLSALRMVGDKAVSSARGVLCFIWAKISTIRGSRLNGVEHLERSGSSYKSKAMSATLVRPTTDTQFQEMLHYLGMVLTALGIAHFTIVLKFIDDVVWRARRMGESWQVASELIILYMRKIDHDTSGKLHLANVFEYGGQDTLLVEARRRAAAFSGPDARSDLEEEEALKLDVTPGVGA
jgi:hypothetical protein